MDVSTCKLKWICVGKSFVLGIRVLCFEVVKSHWKVVKTLNSKREIKWSKYLLIISFLSTYINNWEAIDRSLNWQQANKPKFYFWIVGVLYFFPVGHSQETFGINYNHCYFWSFNFLMSISQETFGRHFRFYVYVVFCHGLCKHSYK